MFKYIFSLIMLFYSICCVAKHTHEYYDSTYRVHILFPRSWQLKQGIDKKDYFIFSAKKRASSKYEAEFIMFSDNLFPRDQKEKAINYIDSNFDFGKQVFKSITSGLPSREKRISEIYPKSLFYYNINVGPKHGEDFPKIRTITISFAIIHNN